MNKNIALIITLGSMSTLSYEMWGCNPNTPPHIQLQAQAAQMQQQLQRDMEARQRQQVIDQQQRFAQQQQQQQQQFMEQQRQQQEALRIQSVFGRK